MDHFPVNRLGIAKMKFSLQRFDHTEGIRQETSISGQNYSLLRRNSFVKGLSSAAQSGREKNLAFPGIARVPPEVDLKFMQCFNLTVHFFWCRSRTADGAGNELGYVTLTWLIPRRYPKPQAGGQQMAACKFFTRSDISIARAFASRQGAPLMHDLLQ